MEKVANKGVDPETDVVGLLVSLFRNFLSVLTWGFDPSGEKGGGQIKCWCSVVAFLRGTPMMVTRGTVYVIHQRTEFGDLIFGLVG